MNFVTLPGATLTTKKGGVMTMVIEQANPIWKLKHILSMGTIFMLRVTLDESSMKLLLNNWHVNYSREYSLTMEVVISLVGFDIHLFDYKHICLVEKNVPIA